MDEEEAGVAEVEDEDEEAGVVEVHRPHLFPVKYAILGIRLE